MNDSNLQETESPKRSIAPNATACDAPGSDHARRAPKSHDEKLRTYTLQVERKAFVFTLMENERGQFLRITEGVVGRRNHIIIPSTGLADFGRLVAAMDEVPERPQA